MNPTLVFSIAGVVLLLGFLGEWIFEKTKIPDPLWLMLFGIILARFLDVASHPAFREMGTLFTLFALIFLLFEGVLNENLKSIFFGFMRGSSVSIINFILTIIVTAAFMKFFGWNILEGVLLGIVVSDSAQAVIIPLMERLNIGKNAYSILAFESVISDVFGIVGAITVINIILLQDITIVGIATKLVYSFAISLMLGTAGGLVWALIHRKMNRFIKSYITTIGALLIMYSIVDYLGANGPLACLAFGVVIANSDKIFAKIITVLNITDIKQEKDISSSAKFFYSEISFFVKSFFFVYLGLVINLTDIRLLLIGFALTLVLIIARPLSIMLSGVRKKVSARDRVYLEILNPKGTSSAVLAQLPLQYGLSRGSEFLTIVISVIACSILMCILLVFLEERGIFRGIYVHVGRLFCRGVRR